MLGKLHFHLIHLSRIERLRSILSGLISDGSRVLDVGTGDGRLARLIQDSKDSVAIEGIDVLCRPDTAVPVKQFDGQHIPYGAGEFDVVLFVDVLHHCTNQTQLLQEAGRVSRKQVIVKDHITDRFLAYPTLRAMDWVGNARYGVALPYDYWSRQRWSEVFDHLGWSLDSYTEDVRLYPFGINALFGRSLHFVSSLNV